MYCLRTRIQTTAKPLKKIKCFIFIIGLLIVYRDKGVMLVQCRFNPITLVYHPTLCGSPEDTVITQQGTNKHHKDI